MEVRLDAKVSNEKETRALGIEVGDILLQPYSKENHRYGPF